ncbi:hypothetical protein L4C36_17990 [Photobacterium japonica]|uniref:hypothetical protein n=1 Tax=Photobacterium japonica TaxID=2910235 RepID=UPI003D0D16CD
MTTLNSYLNANKFTIIIVLLMLNGGLFFAAKHTRTAFFGQVEALEYTWMTYTDQYKNQLVTKNTFARLNNSADTHAKSINFDYTFTRTNDNGYVAEGDSQSVPIRHNHVYYLDDICSVVFSGPSERTLRNTSLRCQH